MTICVVVADSSRARILLAEMKHSPLIDYKDFVHSESRLREQDLVADGTGTEVDSGGYGKHSMGHEKSAHQRQAVNFAHELGGEIDKLRQNRKLHKIYLVASPKFLGLLRPCMSKQSAKLLLGEVNKDLVNHSIEDICSHLPEGL